MSRYIERGCDTVYRGNNNKMENYIKFAYNQALKSSVHKQYGAVIIYRKKIIGMGFNCHVRPSTKYKSCIL